MSRMVRKQVYLDAEHDRKLKRLARDWKCTEAAVLRRAVEGLPEEPLSPEELGYRRLVAMGLLTPPRGPRLTSEQELKMRRERERVMAGMGHIDISGAVWEDREGR